MDGISYDPKTGDLSFAGKSSRLQHPDGRIRIKWRGRLHNSGRLAWFAFYGEWPIGVVDHINGDPSDNRIANLRDVSQSWNQQNRGVIANGTRSGYVGVFPVRRAGRVVFQAAISIYGKRTVLGLFETAEEASACYVAAKVEMHPGFVVR